LLFTDDKDEYVPVRDLQDPQEEENKDEVNPHESWKPPVDMAWDIPSPPSDQINQLSLADHNSRTSWKFPMDVH